jgi:hypothetical protein
MSIAKDLEDVHAVFGAMVMIGRFGWMWMVEGCIVYTVYSMMK